MALAFVVQKWWNPLWVQLKTLLYYYWFWLQSRREAGVETQKKRFDKLKIVMSPQGREIQD